MRTTRWQLTSAGAIVLATSLGGAASAQVRATHGYVELPSAPVIGVPTPESIRAVPATALPSADGAPAAACCESPGRGGFRSAWERFTGRLEQRCVPQEPDPLPQAQFLYQNFDAQVSNGIAARMVLHDYDFVPGAAALTARGKVQLKQIAAFATRYPFQVIVERPTFAGQLADARQRATLDEELERLGQNRKRVVLDELRLQKNAVVPERVVVGPPISNGLSGYEANLMYQNLLSQTQSRGENTSAGTGNGGFTTGGIETGGQGTPAKR